MKENLRKLKKSIRNFEVSEKKILLRVFYNKSDETMKKFKTRDTLDI